MTSDAPLRAARAAEEEKCVAVYMAEADWRDAAAEEHDTEEVEVDALNAANRAFDVALTAYREAVRAVAREEVQERIDAALMEANWDALYYAGLNRAKRAIDRALAVARLEMEREQ